MATKKETTRTTGRPKAHTSRVEGSDGRADRVPVSGNRDILTVRGKDPNYVYRWVSDVSEDGSRIWKFKQAGYTHVEVSEIKGVGQDRVKKVEGLGSIVCQPTGGSNYSFLMKIRKEFYEEDQARKAEDLDAIEQEMADRFKNTEGDDAVYGAGLTTTRD